MHYHRYQYLWPPRPERAVPPSALKLFEGVGRWAQPKMNGTNCTLYVAPDRSTLQRGRHGDEPVKSWMPGPRWQAFAAGLPGAGWYVFSSELLHTKGTGRDTLYLHDLLVADSDYLIGARYSERYERLSRLCRLLNVGDATPTHHIVAPVIWLAAVYTEGFAAQFAALPPDVEGLVLKQADARLLPCVRPASNAGWQVKCRRAKANLSF